MRSRYGNCSTFTSWTLRRYWLSRWTIVTGGISTAGLRRTRRSSRTFTNVCKTSCCSHWMFENRTRNSTLWEGGSSSYRFWHYRWRATRRPRFINSSRRISKGRPNTSTRCITQPPTTPNSNSTATITVTRYAFWRTTTRPRVDARKSWTRTTLETSIRNSRSGWSDTTITTRSIEYALNNPGSHTKCQLKITTNIHLHSLWQFQAITPTSSPRWLISQSK